MEKLDTLYKVSGKQVFLTEDPNKVIVQYTDDAAAFNGIKRASFVNKGKVVNQITKIVYEWLNKVNIKTAYLKTINETEQLFDKVQYIPIEVICRNIIAGSCSFRLGINEGTKPNNTIYEIKYKCEELQSPFINEHHVVALNILTYDEINTIMNMTKIINKELCDKFDSVDMMLVDFKIEFGKLADGTIVLADEISPDTARIWDKNTKEILDKDRFRKDLGNIVDAYQNILNRMIGLVEHE